MGRLIAEGVAEQRGRRVAPPATTSFAAIERNSEREKKRALSVLSSMTPGPQP